MEKDNSSLLRPSQQDNLKNTLGALNTMPSFTPSTVNVQLPKDQQTLMWQQQQHQQRQHHQNGAWDSGIQSGATTTTAPSLNGGLSVENDNENDQRHLGYFNNEELNNDDPWNQEDDDDEDDEDDDQRQQQSAFTRSQIEDIHLQLQQTRAQRVRAAMFPESLEEGVAIPQTNFDASRPSAVERLAEASSLGGGGCC